MTDWRGVLDALMREGLGYSETEDDPRMARKPPPPVEGDHWETVWGPARWGVFTRPPEEPRVAPELLTLVREAAAEVPNSDAPAIPLDAIASNDLQAVVDLALVSSYRARMAKALDALIFGGRTGEVLGVLAGPEVGSRVVTGPLKTFWTEDHAMVPASRKRRAYNRTLSPFVVRSIDDAYVFEAPTTWDDIVEAYRRMLPP